jgi:Clp amino terminal domain, pathogenicity island component
LIKLGQGVAVSVIKKMGLDLETVRAAVEKQVGVGQETKFQHSIPYTPRFKKVLMFASKEAKTLNHSYVGTEHILLGILREGEGVAARVLTSLDLDIEKTRDEILGELDPKFLSQSFAEDWFVRLIEQLPEFRAMVIGLKQIDSEIEAARQAGASGPLLQLSEKRELASKELKEFRKKKRRQMAGGGQLSLDPLLARYFHEIGRQARFASRDDLAESAAKALHGHLAVLLVAELGCDFDRVLEQIALTAFETSRLAKIIPHIFIKPDHLAFSSAPSGGYGNALEHANATLRHHRNLIVVLEELDALLSREDSGPDVAEAWRLTLRSWQLDNRPIIAWSTPKGRDRLRNIVPGWLDNCKQLSVPPPSSDELAGLVATLLKRELTPHIQDHALGKIAKIVIEHTMNAKARPGLAEPGRSYTACERLMVVFREQATKPGRLLRVLSERPAVLTPRLVRKLLTREEHEA